MFQIRTAEFVSFLGGNGKEAAVPMFVRLFVREILFEMGKVNCTGTARPIEKLGRPRGATFGVQVTACTVILTATLIVLGIT